MEAATSQRALAGDKAQRIVDAMRRSVARRGSAGSTFDHVARDAGVSRGLLHYYFGSKEQLLAEAEAVAEVLFSLADGVALRMLAEPERDFSHTVAAGVTAVRALLDDAP